MIIDYKELELAIEKLHDAEEIIKSLRIELSESRQIVRNMVRENLGEQTVAERTG